MTRFVRDWLTVLATMSIALAAVAANHTMLVGPEDTQIFSPAVLTIRAGDTVTWVDANIGGMSHNVLADDNSFTSGTVKAGPWSYSHTFTAVGTFGYYCQPHGAPGGAGQSGTIVVLEGMEIEHGSVLVDDLNLVADRYRISQTPFSSYEIVVDAVAGNPRLELDRLSSGGSVLQAGTPVSALDMSQSLRWANATASTLDTERIRVSNTICPGAICSVNERYRLRAYETTYAVPRFNNSGSQVTVLILQNPANYTINGSIYFWNAAGTMLNAGGTPFTLTAKNALVLNTSTVSGVAGTSGTMTIAHNARYGDLTGKAVALEPASGFSFDTPGVYRIK